VVMDCDLQDRPEEIGRLYQKALEGYDIVLARRAVRQDHLLKRWGSKLFYKLFGYLTDTLQDPAVSNFGVYHRSVIEAILSMGDYVRVFPVMVQWVGFQRTAIDVGHAAREAGKSSYTLGKLFRLAFGMMLSFSEKPLRLGLRVGLFISFFAFCIGVFNFIKYLKGEILVAGYTSLILSLWFLSGIIIAFIGLTGLYIGKIFEKVKGRPNYIVQSRKNFGE
ncbi:MAG: glycosyltransferase, partial [Saprospiraceae bacterium]